MTRFNLRSGVCSCLAVLLALPISGAPDRESFAKEDRPVEGVPVESVPVAVGTPSPAEPASGVRFLLDVRVDTRYLSVLSFLVWWAVRFALWASVAVPVALLGTVPVALRSFVATLYEQYYRPYEPYYRPPSRSSYDPWSPPKIVAARRPTVMGGAIELDRPVGRGSIVAGGAIAKLGPSLEKAAKMKRTLALEYAAQKRFTKMDKLDIKA